MSSDRVHSSPQAAAPGGPEPAERDPYALALERCGERIIGEAEEMARERGIRVEEAFWGSGRLIPNQVSQTLTLRGGGRTAHGIFDEQWLLDCESPVSRDRVREQLESQLERLASPPEPVSTAETKSSDR
jgi:hypothetical protein